MPTIEQQIAKKEDELSRLKMKQRKLETGQKIIIGGMLLKLAEENHNIAMTLLDQINSNITRKVDIDRLENVVSNLKIWSVDKSL